MSVTQRRGGETDLDYPRRKELAWGLWQGDALERMSQQDQTIDALQDRLRELETTLHAAKDHAQQLARAVIDGMAELKPDDLARDHAPHINAMAAAGVAEYISSKGPRKHKDLRSTKPPKDGTK